MPTSVVVPRLTSVTLLRRIPLSEGRDIWVPEGTRRAVVWSPAPMDKAGYEALRNSLRHIRSLPVFAPPYPTIAEVAA